MQPMHRAIVCLTASLFLSAATVLAAAGGCGRARPELPVRPDPGHPGRFRLDLEAMGTNAALIVRAPSLAAATA